MKVRARTWGASAEPVEHPVGDAAGEDPGLAGTRPGQDAQGRGVGGDRLELGSVELGEQVLMLHLESVRRGCDKNADGR